MSDQGAIAKTADFVKKKLSQDSTGHDWWHVYRVWQLSKHIASKEKGVNMLVVELAALLHDIADWKFHGGDEEIGAQITRKWLRDLRIEDSIIEQVSYIVRHISFKSGLNKNAMKTLEGKIVQDADRIDAMGAIGIARVFATGSSLGRVIYDPAIKLKEYSSLEERLKDMSNDTSINHFYEKLLLLKDLMNTETGRQIAIHRHKFMEDYLEEFYAEWDGKL